MKTIIIGGNNLEIEDVGLIGKNSVKLELSSDPKFIQRIQSGPELLDKLLKDNHKIYGVNTGVGTNAGSFLSPDLVKEMSSQLIQFHGCALGKHFNEVETRAIVVSR